MAGTGTGAGPPLPPWGEQQRQGGKAFIHHPPAPHYSWRTRQVTATQAHAKGTAQAHGRAWAQAAPHLTRS